MPRCVYPGSDLMESTNEKHCCALLVAPEAAANAFSVLMSVVISADVWNIYSSKRKYRARRAERGAEGCTTP